MTAPVGFDAESAVQRLVPLVASASLERGERLQAAQALVELLQDGDPAAPPPQAGGAGRGGSPAVRGAGGRGEPRRGGRWRRGLHAAGELLDFLNPF